ncbi:MAG: hypothetical protein H7178_03380 [Chitinophagaceae bacterium]|nr:hypothetical protein [Chitinophagaceae bacterium]
MKYLDSEDKTAYAVITNKDHVEYYSDGKYYIKSKLKWLNECEYNMTMTKITLPNFPNQPGEVMNVKFEKIENGIVYYSATVKGQTWKGRFEIIN